MYSIYVFTNNVNGKQYVGLTPAQISMIFKSNTYRTKGWAFDKLVVD